MGKVCSTLGRKLHRARCCKNLKERDWLEVPGLYGSIIEMNFKGTGWDGVDRINLVLDIDKRVGSCEHYKLKFIFLKYGEFLDYPSNYLLLKGPCFMEFFS
jgi:hypothetical protein